MANNYMAGSFLVTLTKAQIEHLKQLLTEYENVLTEYENGAADGEYSPHIHFEVEQVDDPLLGQLWFHDTESFEVDTIAELIATVLEAAKSEESVAFQWAFTCSKPRLDEFGGGAVVISRLGATYFSGAQWIAEETTRLQATLKSIPV